jgi:hypothetical protein
MTTPDICAIRSVVTYRKDLRPDLHGTRLTVLRTIDNPDIVECVRPDGSKVLAQRSMLEPHPDRPRRKGARR